MCGRITLSSSGRELAEKFTLEDEPEVAPRFNIAPTQPVAIVRADVQQRRRLSSARWGLVPSWAEDISIGNRMINARAETVARKGAFRQALRARRCIVPVSGFYEWQGEAGQRTPYLFAAPDRSPFALAGLWEEWSPQSEAPPLVSCTIITTEANARLRPIHDRMPVLLGPRDYARWLDPRVREADDASALLVPCPPSWLEAIRVGPRVNDARNEDPRCIEPV